MKKLLLLLGAAALLYPLDASSVTRSQSAGSNETNVSIQLADPAGSVYQENEPIRMSVQTDSDAFVAVFNIDTDGFVHLLYPADSGSFRRMNAGRYTEIPARSDETFLVSGSTGLEMIFALAVKDKDDLDELEVSFLMNNSNLPDESKYRIDGDPFLAANDIASRLVRNIENNPSVTLAYTYFYINTAVEYPRYLCGDCYTNGQDPYDDNMPRYTPTLAFDASAGLSYPLAVAFERDTPAATSPGIAYDYEAPVKETHVYVHYPSTRYYYYPSSWYYWDYYAWRPYCNSYYPYYPAPYRGGFYFSIGWNWGHYGSYYGHPYYPYHGGTYYADTRPVRGSIRHSGGTRYKGTSSGTLYDDLHYKNRERTVARRDGMRTKTASADNSRKIVAKKSRDPYGKKGYDDPSIMSRPQTANPKGGSGGPIVMSRPQSGRTKSGNGGPVVMSRPDSKRTKGGNGGPIAMRRPDSKRAKGGNGGPMIQPGVNGGSGDATVHRGKKSRTVKPLTRQTRPGRETYNPRAKKGGTRPSIQSRADKTKRLQSRSTRSGSKYRSNPKSRSTRSTRSVKGSSSRSSGKSKSSIKSRPTRSSSKSRSVSKPSRSSGSRSKSSSAGRSRSSSRGKKSR